MKKWNPQFPDRKLVSELSIKLGVSTLVGSVLASRGFSSAESAYNALENIQLSDPFLITDMEKAADIINNAIDSGSSICVYGDYDCDGIMSTVMLYLYLLEAGADVTFYIPERAEGYGLNADAVRSIAKMGTDLIITVDNGISAIAEAELIYECGMKLVITDHHLPGETLPKAEAVVDLHRNDCFSPFKHLCGAGVVLKLIAALDGGDYTMALEQFGDLAAIATVADIVELTGENRFIVKYGLELIRNTDRPALMALIDAAGLKDKPFNAFSIGFGIAPRINAAGRFGSPKQAAQLFICEDFDEALVLAKDLDSLNSQRKECEAEIMSEICSIIDADPSLLYERILFLCGENWHHGVIGIIASRVMSMFGKQSFIASASGDEIRGSVRAFSDEKVSFNVYEALAWCKEKLGDELEKFGGHGSAGGFTVGRFPDEKISNVNLGVQQVNSFKDALLEYAALHFKDGMPSLPLNIDAPVSPFELTAANVKSLSVLEPFGCKNEKPLFLIENALVEEIFPLKNGAHSKLIVKFGPNRFEALMFGVSPASLCVSKGDWCDMAVSLEINSYKGAENVNLFIADCRPHGFKQGKFFAGLSVFEAFMREEELPEHYYPSMFPVRDEVASVYLKIPPDGINSDNLYLKLQPQNPNLNYCKFRVAVEALCQLGLVKRQACSNTVFRLKAEKKVDLLSAPVLVRLGSKIKKS